VDTDDLARRVVSAGEPALVEIRSAFGASVFDASGELNRPALADVVFRDASARKQLEAILHPRILHLWREQLTVWRNDGRSAAAVIIPLLFETWAESEFDLVLCLACSAATQQQRLLARGLNCDQIQERLSAQMPIADKMARAHRVIWNEGDLEVLNQQCARIISSANGISAPRPH
jgi:dephospho-CoA kinase